MAADLVTIATTAALTQFVGPMFKNLGEQALERAKQVANKAVAQLKVVGRDPQPVEPKLLLPLVQAASLENNETLIDRWAALLANAADPAQKVKVQPSFSEILRQLTPTEALLATAITNFTSEESSVTKRASLFQTTYAYRRINGISDEEFAIAIDNLCRLSLTITRGPVPSEAVVQLLGGLAVGANEVLPGKERIAMTILGLTFLTAVTPPTA
jgi:hypothetical protein